MRASRAIAITAACAAAASMSIAAPVLADNGKSAYGCSNPYYLVHWDSTGQLYFENGTPDPVTAAGLSTHTYDSTFLLPLYAAIDHNGDVKICEKHSNGDVQDVKHNVYDNLTDDKVLS